MNTITPHELKEKIKNEKVFVLDVRAEEKYLNEHIQDANIQSVNIPKTDIFSLEEQNADELLSALPADKEIIITCTTGNSARKCASILAEKDYHVTLLEGGLTAWKENTLTK
ncbi:rhodanese-like domain-containing protein [Cytobacillus sp. NCCP-133]|uniref:rhodanese-like domain-containing protein n=1 Tax=Cytobacillus sp. NCCP-133 TaxID=766848 RepID=UPI002231C124|nr:rhodanese-like domain-containing protein [Cytobacillus sp. NCCP-133]GLB60125.1 hypothetical protein NCCP133_22570 [Cytobacillus sp. NCCP-133]